MLSRAVQRAEDRPARPRPRPRQSRFDPGGAARGLAGARGEWLAPPPQRPVDCLAHAALASSAPLTHRRPRRLRRAPRPGAPRCPLLALARGPRAPAPRPLCRCPPPLPARGSCCLPPLPTHHSRPRVPVAVRVASLRAVCAASRRFRFAPRPARSRVARRGGPRPEPNRHIYELDPAGRCGRAGILGACGSRHIAGGGVGAHVRAGLWGEQHSSHPLLRRRAIGRETLMHTNSGTSCWIGEGTQRATRRLSV
jgi:hypothetical protein